MDKLPVSVTYLILRHLSKSQYHSLSLFATKQRAWRGWHRAIDNCTLFRVIHTRDHTDVTERRVWKRVFPDFPRLHLSYVKNYKELPRFNMELLIQDAVGGFMQNDVDAEDYHMIKAVSAMQEFQTPHLTPNILHFMLRSIDEPTLVLDALIQLYDWPRNLNMIMSSTFWAEVGELIERQSGYLKYGQESPLMTDVRNFVLKYYEHIRFDKNAIHWYKCLTETILVQNPSLSHKVNWTKVIITIPLSEDILDEIMGCFDKKTREPFRGQYPNIAYIASNQIISEAFIERWFVNMPDIDHIWINIFKNRNLQLTQEFREKYGGRGGKSLTSALRELLDKTDLL